MAMLMQDLRFAVRRLWKNPGFTTVVVLTLALGIGAAASIFSVVRGVLLEPLPYAQPHRIAQVWQVNEGGNENAWSEPNFQDVRHASRSFSALAAYGSAEFTVLGAGEAARVMGAVVSDGFFEVLGSEPALGRTFSAEEHAESAPVAVVSDGYWRTRLGGERDAIGRTIRLDGREFTVVGVAPARFAFPVGAELWIPRTERANPSRTAHNWRAIGRLAEGVTFDQARQEVHGLAVRLREQHGADTWMIGATVVPLHEEMVGDVRPALLVLLGAAGLLLLIACANVANLLLAQATTRRRELAVRVALGAGRIRLPRQLVVESVALALLGGAGGVVLAVVGVDALLALEPGRLPRVETVAVDWAVVAFALLVATGAALAIGLVPALQAAKPDVRGALIDGGRVGGGDRGTGRFRSGLVATQVALTVLLLVGAGLLARSFLRLISLDPGYHTEGAVVAELALASDEVPSGDPRIVGSINPRAAAALEQMLARLRSLPRAERVGAINAFPLTGGGANGMFLVQEREDEVRSFEDWNRLSGVPERVGFADYRVATPGYFQAMGIPVIRGRAFDQGDGMGTAPVAVISASLARTKWPDQDPIGKLIQFGNMDGDLRPLRVIGVVGDVRDRTLEAEPTPTVYGNALQRTSMLGGRFSIVIRSAAAPAALIAPARQVATEIAPEMPVRFRTLEEIFARSLADRRFSLVLLGVFGATALLLAGLGLYGLVAYLVAQRTREVGIRMALGARRGTVVALVLRHGLELTILGIVVGGGVAYAASRVLASQLYGIQATDPLTFIAAGLLLAAVALLASYVPARRAARVDPMVALRSD